MENKRGNVNVKVAIGVVVLLILISALAPTALVGLFNATAFRCPGGHINTTGCFVGDVATDLTGVPVWIVTALGALGAIAFIYVIYRSYNS